MKSLVHFLFACVTFLGLSMARAEPGTSPATDSLLPPDWNPVSEADQVLERLVKVTGPEVKGAHDSEMALVGEHAYVIAEMNDRQAGESPSWDFVYVSMSIINLQTLEVEARLPVARSQQQFTNAKLPTGACFVPRVLPIGNDRLRCYFTSERPGRGQSQIWYRDFNLSTRTFADKIEKVKIKTSAGVLDMQPRYFHEDAVRDGFDRPAKDFAIYLFDPLKRIGGRPYLAINNYVIGQNALALWNDSFDTVEIVGHYNRPLKLKLTESAVNQLPDGTWMAICRQEAGNRNYLFTTSEDGKTWSVGEHRKFVPNGAASKPTFDRFGGIYYLGWQEATQIDKANRSVFNIDVSRDGTNWQRKYSFRTTQSFQYPTFREHNGSVWVCVTQGDSSPSRKERIMFGKLESLPTP